MVGQRAVAVRVAGSRPRRVLAGPERAGQPAMGGVSPPLVVRVPVRVKARGLAAVVRREPPRELRRGHRGFRERRRPTARRGRAVRLPPMDLVGPAALAARRRVANRAAARVRAMVVTVKVHAGRRVRRTPARREQVLPRAGHARAGRRRVPLLMMMFAMAAEGPRPAASFAAPAGPRPRVSSVAVRGPRHVAEPGRPTGTPPAAPCGARLGHHQVALPVTGPGLRGRKGPGRRAAGTASVTAVGPQIATSGVMTAVRLRGLRGLRGLRALVPAVPTAMTLPQRATGRVAPAVGIAPRLPAASVLTTGA
jgi:hypothetical protein